MEQTYKTGTDNDYWVRSCAWSAPGCHPVGCGIKLHVVDGKLVEVEGDEQHPITPVSYTHLDVYKRQADGRVRGWPPPHLRAPCWGTKETRLMAFGVRSTADMRRRWFL